MLTIDARLATNQSGIGTYVRHIVPGILEAFPTLRICLLGDRAELAALGWLDRPGVHALPLNAPMYSISEQWRTHRAIPKETTLFFSPHYNVPIFYRGRVLVTVHDLFHLVSQRETSIRKLVYAALLFRVVRHRAKAVITNSRFTRDEFVRLMPASKQPIYPIHLGVSEGWFRAGALRTCSARPPYVIYVGNVKPHKNIRGLIAAFETMADKVPHNLVVAGPRDGLITSDPEAERMAQGLGGRIRFTGYVDDPELKSLVANADALVLPSFYEGFGFPPVEAMAAGCPTAVSDIPALREICQDAALYFDPNKPIEIASQLIRLLQDDELRTQLRHAGLRRASELTWDSCVAATCAVLRDLLAAPETSEIKPVV